MNTSFLFFLCILLQSATMTTTSKNEQPITQLLEKATNTLEEKYAVIPLGHSVSMPGGNLKQIGLEFQIVGPLSQEKIRNLLLAMAEDFLQFVHTEISPSCASIEMIELTLFVVDAHGNRCIDPSIGIATLSKGTVTYEVCDDSSLPCKAKQYQETYEQAKNTLSQQ